jgi:hypothetical protein
VAFAARGRLGTSAAERRRVQAYMQTFRAAEARPGALTGSARGKNLILVLAESLTHFPSA